MKILQMIPDLGTGGAERLLVDLTVALRDGGDDVRVLVLRGSTGSALERELQAAGVPVDFLHGRPGVHADDLARLRRYVRLHRPDVLHTHRYALRYAVLGLLARRRRWIHTVHSVADRELTPRDRVVARIAFATRMAMPVAVSPAIQASVRTLYRMRRVQMIWNAIRTDRFVPAGRPARQGPLVIANVGRLQPVKNHGVLLAAAARLRRRDLSFRLRIAGDGPLREELATAIRELDLVDSVELLGERDDVASVLTDADLFVLPSAYEGLPLSLLEAMGAGLPCVASAVGGVPDVIEHEVSGLLVPAGDAEALARTLEELGQDPDRCRLLGDGARRRVEEQFSLTTMTAHYRALYGEGHVDVAA